MHAVGVSVGESVGVAVPSQFACVLAAAVRRQHAAPAGLGHPSFDRGHQLPVLVRVCRQQLFQKPRGAVVRAQRRPEAGLALLQCLQRQGGQAAHSCLAIHALVVVLLRLRRQAGGAVSLVPGAGLHHGRRGGLGGSGGFCPTSDLRVVGREQVEIVQKVLHHVLGAASKRACHLCQAGERGRHLCPRGSWVAHMHVCLAEVILGHERGEAPTQGAGVRAGPRPEAVPHIEVVVAVRVGASRPLGIGAWAVAASIRTPLQSQLGGDKTALSTSTCISLTLASSFLLCNSTRLIAPDVPIGRKQHFVY